MKQSFSIIVPVFNEESILAATLSSVLDAVDDSCAEIIYVCNGTTDNSAQIIRSIAGSRVKVIELAVASKTAAFNAGEKLVSSFPRFFLDADILVTPNVFLRLAQVLNSGQADLVSPIIQYELSGSSRAARSISNIWLSLPHGRKQQTQNGLIGVSERGRARWVRFPDVLADDKFMMAMTPKKFRTVVDDVVVTTNLPRTYLSWVSVRARWLMGNRQLNRAGIAVPHVSGQQTELLRKIFQPNLTVSAFMYVAARVHAFIKCIISERKNSGWFQDRSSRKQ